jgi:hypothetical protein
LHAYHIYTPFNSSWFITTVIFDQANKLWSSSFRILLHPLITSSLLTILHKCNLNSKPSTCDSLNYYKQVVINLTNSISVNYGISKFIQQTNQFTSVK